MPAVVPPRSPPRSAITQFSSHSSSASSRDGDTRTSSRSRSRSGAVESWRRDAVPLAGSRARRRRRRPAARAARRARVRAARRVGVGERAPVARDETAQRQRVLGRCMPLRARVGQELEEHARAGVVVVDRRDDERAARAREARTNRRSSSCMRRAPPVEHARRPRRVGARHGVGEPPGLEQPAAQAHVRPDALLHARRRRPRRTRCRARRPGSASARVAAAGASSESSAHVAVEQPRDERPAARRRARARRSASPPRTARRRASRSRSACSASGPVPRARFAPGARRGRCDSHAVHSSSWIVAPRRGWSRALRGSRASAAGPPRLARVDQGELERDRAAPTTQQFARRSARRRGELGVAQRACAAGAARSGRARRTCRASASRDAREVHVVGSRSAELDEARRGRAPALRCRARAPGPLARAGTSRAASSASSVAT